DLLQTALTKAWFAWPRIDAPEAYVRKTMVTTYTSWWRRKWRSEVPTQVLVEPLGEALDVRLEDRELLTSALDALAPRQRAVIVLRYYEDLTEVQTAHLLGCSVGTVKSQSSRALAKLRVNPTLVANPAKEN
ncbi:MAG TPA: SigE family RNA polymerase sigma factor, partial [Candidatus Limnocylindria bacterium]|nr:SigE family RNA polymerase sigma factor [Candidatus Limnocylindria bacterium]